MLAGMIRAPAYYDPLERPRKALAAAATTC